MSARTAATLFNEGQLISFASQRTAEEAIEQARGVADGCFNAMLRLGAAEDAAGFAYAVADRMVDRVKEPTAWPLAKAPNPAPAARFGFWTIFAIGYGCCALPAAIIIANLVR